MAKILIVDDEPHIARLIEMTLEPLGQPLVLACDGEQAADLLEKQQFDLVLLDVMLPGVDGFALMDYIAPTGTPVIFLTAKNAVADRVRGLKLGAYDYIVKPFDTKEVVARIKAIARRVSDKSRGLTPSRCQMRSAAAPPAAKYSAQFRESLFQPPRRSAARRNACAPL